jgi:outer membrane protein OmpA-like peptidoglycan-associated protein
VITDKILACLFFLGIPLTAHAEEAEGCKDNALTGRYEGASITYCKAKDFDELVFLKAPHDYGALLERNALKDRSGPEWLKKAGKADEIRYNLKDNTSALEAASNFEARLKSNGFEVVFSCEDQECLSGSVTDTYVLGQQLDPTNVVSTAYGDHARYMLARRDGATVSVLVGEDKEKSVAFLRIVEDKPMQNKIGDALASRGSADIYGILFDFDYDVVKPESKPALDEIAKALSDKPQMRLKIVGHTDNKGGEAYNLDLSKRRAANVLAALRAGYGIDSARLTSEGAGLSKPIASNDSEDGRAKNRRVELVVQ